MRDIALEYRITRTDAGCLRVAGRGWLRFDGADRLAFLQALLTNDVTALTPSTGGYGLYLTPQGRLIADLELLHRGDHVLVGVPSELSGDLASTFDRVIFSEDVQVVDVSATLATLAVVGERAAEVTAAALGADAGAISRLAPWSQLDARDGFIARADVADAAVFYLVTPAAVHPRVRQALVHAGAGEISADLMDALRIDAARPRFGVDMTTETIPLEAGLLDRAISQTKGCYVGQEVIIRVLHRGAGRIAKRLVQFTSTDVEASVPAVGAAVLIDGREVGSVTSAALSPAAGRVRALGYVKRDHAEVGRAVTIEWAGHTLAATITRLAG